jgi:hypothetical protein
LTSDWNAVAAALVVFGQNHEFSGFITITLIALLVARELLSVAAPQSSPQIVRRLTVPIVLFLTMFVILVIGRLLALL